MGMFTNIVVAVDFSDSSPEVLQYAAQLAAGSSGAALHVLHVVPDPLQQWGPEAIGVNFAAMDAEWRANAAQQMAVLLAGEASAAVATQVIRVGRAPDTIAAYAAATAASIVVLGSHGHGAVRRFFLGSVAEQVLRLATCPVLVVPHRTLQSRPGDASVAAVTVA